MPPEENKQNTVSESNTTEPVVKVEAEPVVIESEVKTISAENSNVVKPDVSESYVEAKQEIPTPQPVGALEYRGIFVLDNLV